MPLISVKDAWAFVERHCDSLPLDGQEARLSRSLSVLHEGCQLFSMVKELDLYGDSAPPDGIAYSSVIVAEGRKNIGRYLWPETLAR